MKKEQTTGIVNYTSFSTVRPWRNTGGRKINQRQWFVTVKTHGSIHKINKIVISDFKLKYGVS